MQFVLLLFSIIPHSSDVVDRVDIIELNYIHNHDNSIKGVYYVFWEWLKVDGIFVVVDWRNVRDIRSKPHKFNNKWKLTWKDHFYIRSVIAYEFKTTHTYYDPEILNREILPVSKRRKLSSSIIGRTDRNAFAEIPLPDQINF